MGNAATAKRGVSPRSLRKVSGNVPSCCPDSLDDLKSALDDQNVSIEFLKKEFAGELLECYRKIRAFECCIEGDEASVAAAKEVSSLYFQEGACRELDLDPSTKRSIVERANGVVTASMFDDVKRDLVMMMAKEKLERFVDARRYTRNQVDKICDACCSSSAGKKKQCARLSARYSQSDQRMLMSPDVIRGQLGLKDLAYPPLEPEVPRPIPKDMVGAISCHGQNHGKYKVNQDRSLTAYPFPNFVDFGGDRSALFVLADGHGPHGHHVADYVVRNVWNELKESVKDPNPDFERLLVAAFEDSDANLEDLDILKFDRQASGCTCVAALLVETTLYVASTGDSKLVVAYVESDQEDVGLDKEDTSVDSSGRGGDNVHDVLDSYERCQLSAKQLTKEHTLLDCDEVERIEQAGGIVEPAPDFAADRIWFDDSFQGPGLQPTRTIGDHAATRIGVIATPSTAKYSITDKDKFIVIASDGLWEHVSEAQSVRIAEDTLRENAKQPDRAELAAVSLMDVASKHWLNEGDGYADDISVTVAMMPPWSMPTYLHECNLGNARHPAL